MKFTLLTILDIKHTSQDGKILWESKNLTNIFHLTGEQYMLLATFAGDRYNSYIPSYYYFGLDDRSSLNITDTMTTVSSAEASGGGYYRQSIASSNQFSMSVGTNGHYMATSPIITFTATAHGSGWGPVKNLFLTDKPDDTGFLISSVPLNTPVTVSAGDGIYMRMGLSLGDCQNLSSV